MPKRPTGTVSVIFCSGSPNGKIWQYVAATPPSRVTLIGGQVRLKSKVNSYVLGEQAQISMPIRCDSVDRVDRASTTNAMIHWKLETMVLLVVVLAMVFCCFSWFFLVLWGNVLFLSYAIESERLVFIVYQCSCVFGNNVSIMTSVMIWDCVVRDWKIGRFFCCARTKKFCEMKSATCRVATEILV